MSESKHNFIKKCISAFSVKAMIAMGKHTCNKIERMSKTPLRHSEAFLMKVLKTNRNTVFGKAHEFKNIGSIEEFCKKVPLSTYDDYAEPIQRMADGEKNLIMKGEPLYYVETSGCTGSAKLIPNSKKFSDVANSYEYLQKLMYLWSKEGKITLPHIKSLLIVAITDLEMTKSGVPIGDFVGMHIHSQRLFLKYLMTTPLESMLNQEIHDRIYVHLRFSLLDEDVSIIAASFISEIYEMMRYLFEHQEMIINDFAEGTIDESVKISPKLREKLLSRIKPDKEKADRLRQILDGSREGIMCRLWPNLSVVAAVGECKDFEFHTNAVKHYLNDSVYMYYITHAASEGLFGTVIQLDKAVYTMVTDSVFMEFIEIENSEAENPHVLTIEQLEAGKLYEIVLTNNSGLYRYRIGDVIRIVGFHNKMPQYRFAYRKNMLINIAGEKTNVEHIAETIRRAKEKTGFDIEEYAVCQKCGGQISRYHFYIECAKKCDTDIKKLEGVLHDELCAVNPDYEYIYNLGMIGMPTAQIIAQGSLANIFHARKMHSTGGGNDIKPICIIDENKEEYFSGIKF